MCGLWGGVSTTLMMAERAIIRELGILGQLRGTDSTGMMISYREGGEHKLGLHKELGHSSNFLDQTRPSNMIAFSGTYMIAGHSRAATMGVVELKNAHPFVEGHIVGMHNGTVPALHGKLNGESVTDSQLIFNELAVNGLASALSKAESGAYALCWVDGEKSTLNFIRNLQRPLWFAWRNDCMFWSSERGALDYVRSRTPDGKWENPFTLTANEQLVYDLKTGRSRLLPPPSKKVLLPPAGKQAVHKPSPPPATAGVPLVPRQGKEADKVGEKAVEKKADTGVNGHKTLMYVGFRGKKMTMQKAEELLARGCTFAADRVATIDECVYWINNKEYVCQTTYKEGVLDQLWDGLEMHESAIETTYHQH